MCHREFKVANAEMQFEKFFEIHDTNLELNRDCEGSSFLGWANLHNLQRFMKS